MNNRSVLCSFNDSFTETLWPYYFSGTDSEPLKYLVSNI